jgi:toxin YxiD
LSTKAAQYLPGVNTKALEKRALGEGERVLRPNGAFWTVFKSKDPVGYDGGELTHWIRSEYSSGTYHGHPIGLNRLKKYTKAKEE